MSLRRLIIPLLLGLLGYAALVPLARRFDLSAGWGNRLDRGAAAARAREAAAAFYGVDTAGWEATFKAEYQKQADYYLQRYAPRVDTSLITPVKTTVVLVEPAGERRRIRVELTAGGRPLGFASRAYAAPEPQPGAPNAAAEETRAAASDALARLAGYEAAKFKLVSETRQKGGEWRYVWEGASPGAEGLKLQGEAVARGRAVNEISIRVTFTPRVTEEFTASRNNDVTVLNVLNIISVTLAVLAILVYLVLGFMRREIVYRQFLALLAAAFLFYVAYYLFSGELEADLLVDVFRAGPGNANPLVKGGAILLFLPLFFALGFALVWASGLALARRWNPAPYASFAALLRGRLLSSSVAERVSVGLLLGGVLAAIPHAMAVGRLFGAGVIPEELSPQIFVARAPALGALFSAAPLPLFTIYGFLVPLFGRRRSGGARAARVAGLIAGSLWLGEAALFQPSTAAALLTGLALAFVADHIYWRYDFLTLVAAAAASEAGVAAAGLCIHPLPVLRRAGLLAFAGMGAAFLLSLAVARAGRRTQEEDELALAIPASTGQQAERERLIAEFGVARNAQQRMLPDVPPTVPGYSISAACRPALEVGGDLYDFLVLPDERVGIVVADVSGKGVPAALYMTLTKGLLASVAERESDPSAILREVNRHLYEVCRRKVFVTLIFGVLDPATRTLTYARAGHNPGVWSGAAQGAPRLLNAPGIGLGMAGGKTFDRVLRHEQLELGAGDTVVFYSDGVTEAMDAAGEEFGVERLLAVIARCDGMGAGEVRDAILNEVYTFVGETPPHDDMTVVVIRVADP